MGSYCALTHAAVRSFQDQRGLRADGVCDETTCGALVEASWRLGDRPLFLTLPNLRGDDVADLQSRLARLGFDSGRVDGILGPRTAQALTDFQSNCGLVSDGICGIETVRAMQRVSAHSGDGPGVSTVRERERMRSGPGSVAHCRVVIGQFGGLGTLTRAVAKELRQAGATVMPLDEPDPVAQAMAANHFAADVYIGFEAMAEPAATVYFYKVPTFESVGGRALADALREQLDHLVADAHRVGFGSAVTAATVEGMRLPVLRETRMPAVVMSVGPTRTVTDAATHLATAVVRAIENWASRAS